MATIHQTSINRPWPCHYDSGMNNYSVSPPRYEMSTQSSNSATTVQQLQPACWSSSSGVFNSASRSSILNDDYDNQQYEDDDNDDHEPDGDFYMTVSGSYYKRQLFVYHNSNPMKSSTLVQTCSTSTPLMLDDLQKYADSTVDNGRALSSTLYSSHLVPSGNPQRSHSNHFRDSYLIDPDILMEFQSVCDELMTRSNSLFASNLNNMGLSERSLLKADPPPPSSDWAGVGSVPNDRLLPSPAYATLTRPTGSGGGGSGGLRRSPGVVGVSDLVHKTDAELQTLMQQAADKNKNIQDNIAPERHHQEANLYNEIIYTDASITSSCLEGNLVDADVLYAENWFRSTTTSTNHSINWLDKPELANIDECSLSGSFDARHKPVKSSRIRKIKSKPRKAWNWFQFCGCVPIAKRQ